jgi:hypothetical protein
MFVALKNSIVEDGVFWLRYALIKVVVDYKSSFYAN